MFQIILNDSFLNALVKSIGEILEREREGGQKIYIFFEFLKKMESQVPNAGSVSRSGSLVDLHLEVVVAELAVVLKLKLNRQILKENKLD